MDGWYAFNICNCLLLAAVLKVLSWNIRELNSPVKKLVILRTIKQMDAGIVCLQETHFSPDSTPCLSPRLFVVQYHSTYLTYSRGV